MTISWSKILSTFILVLIAGVPLFSSHGQQPEPVILNFWHTQGAPGWPTHSPDNPSMEYIWQAVERFQADHPNVTIAAEAHVNDKYKTEIIDALEQDNAPCVFPSWGGGPLVDLIENAYVVNLTRYMNEGDYSDRFYPGALEHVTYEDRVWGVPVEGISIAVIFYNKDVFARLGLVPPQTFDELLTIIETLTQKGYIPFALANESGWAGSMHYMYLVDRLGGPSIFEAAANQTGGSFEDPIFIRAAELLQQMVELGAFNADANFRVFDDGDSRELLYPGIPVSPADAASANDFAVMELMGTWNISIFMKEIYDHFNENPHERIKRIGFSPYPRVEGGRGDPDNLIGSIGDQFYHVAATCSHPDLAFEFIQYLIDDESAQIRAANGRIPPLRDPVITDPNLADVMVLVEKAPHIQLWYDQYLPPELGKAHLDIVKRLFTPSISPQQAGREMQEATVEYFQKHNP